MFFSFLTDFCVFFLFGNHRCGLSLVIFHRFLMLKLTLFNVKCGEEAIDVFHINIFPGLYYVIFYQVLVPRKLLKLLFFLFFFLFLLLLYKVTKYVYFFEETDLFLFSLRILIFIRTIVNNFKKLVLIFNLESSCFFFDDIGLSGIVIGVIFVT